MGTQRILLVDDNQIDIELTLSAFNDTQLESLVHIVQSGQEALDFLFGEGKYSDRNKFPLPNIILLDLKMQGIDGYDVLIKVKETPLLKRIPVIMFTSSKDNNDMEKCYDLGANSYIIKPLSFGDLIKTLEKINDYWSEMNVSPRPDKYIDTRDRPEFIY